MDDTMELVSPEQLPEGTSSRFLLGGTPVTVLAERRDRWAFPDLGVCLEQRDTADTTEFVVTGHDAGGTFIEALALLREIAQHEYHGGERQG
ncbi:hypothetical protein [Leucobacter massiliensis]|uniref:Uncharacterized protein n=1 Tax=Leucobacter massiliensis TaxID=1686285 RepID=A0A2S9QQK9_9MICO|nr:hypothetical protein [Leucobacter massiliensis]PRI11864.1 hypothetical protein B4915_05390 [Leucobacter massiliensis]